MENEKVTYEIILRDSRGSREFDAIAVTVQGSWHDTVSRYDGANDIGFVTLDKENAEYLESLLDADENVISYRVR
jgi:hypothetical protein